nr:putative reverse transcriptase domain-containing protein [Tanacetum cinerariifolium]
MDVPPSPNHVFNFLEAEFEEDPQEEPEEEVEEDPEEGHEEGPEEDPEAEAENDVPPPATSPVGSPITPPPLSEEQERDEEMVKVKKHLGTLKANYSLALSDRDEWRRAIMPPKMMKQRAVNKMVKKQIAEAIEEYERTRVDLGNASGSGEANTGGPVTVQGCSHKTFMNGKPHPFNGTEGVVGLRRWIEKVEQVFEIYPQLCMRRLIWHENWWSKRSKERLRELMKIIKGYGKSTKEITLTTTIIPTIATATATTTTTTLSTTSRIEGKRLLGPMLQPQLKERLMLKIYPSVTGATYTTLVISLQSVEGVRGWVILKHIGHLRRQCPKGRNQQNGGARGRAYVVVENPHQNLNVVTGTFLLNYHYASILFDSGAERSFVSIEFTPFINISSVDLNTSYEVELADGKIVSTDTVLRGCTLALFSHMFKINLLPTRLGSFDVIVGMDWLSYHRAVIVCYEKIVCIPLPNGEILEIHGEKPKKDPKSLSCIKADEVRLNNIHTVCDFLEVFPDDLT